MVSKKTKELKKQIKDSEWGDFKIAWEHLNLGWRIILIIGIFATFWIFYSLGQWLFDQVFYIYFLT